MTYQESDWQKLLDSMTSEQKEFWKSLIDDFILVDQIEHDAFKANINALSDESFHLRQDPLTDHLTKTISRFTSPLERPLAYPLWFFAAYPDVVAWITDLADNSNKMLLKIFGCENEEQFEAMNPLDNEHHFKSEFLRKIIDYYIQNVSSQLEAVRNLNA